MKPRLTHHLMAALLCVVVTAQVRAQLPNAWQISDASTTAVLSYTNTLTSPLQVAATNAGFDFSINARYLTIFGGTHAMTMIYGLGSRRFLIWWNRDAKGDLTAELEGGGTYTLTTNGTGATLYHTHEINYDAVTRKASYLFDGVALTTNWAGSATTWPAGEITWGSRSASGQGQMNFHRVSFIVTNGIVASYNAGTEPTNAPDPESQGWSLSPSSPPSGTSASGISPDAVPLPSSSAVTTLAAVDVEPYQATFPGAVNSGGLAAAVWFEWGNDTNYGNATAPQFLPADTNAMDFSQTIEGLAKGAHYHFRGVVTNTLGTAYGQDAEFTTPSEFSVSTLADSGNGSLRQCISAAQSGDTITIATNGVVKLTTSELLATKSLTIAGPGPANLAIDGGHNFRVLEIAASNVVTLNSLTLTNGYASASGNFYTAYGGGVFVNSGAALTISNCTLSGNSAVQGGGGGGLENYRGTVTVHNSTISDNSAGIGGGIDVDTGGVVTIHNSTVSDNSAAAGGGIYSDNGGTVALYNSAFVGNSANHSAGGLGGGIYNGSGIFTLNNCTFAGNSAPGGDGGGLYSSGGGSSNALHNCTFAVNSAGTGGGIYQGNAGMCILTNTIVAGNTASSSPNIYAQSFQDVTLVNSLTTGDPLLAPLSNYGSPTQTMPPLAGSPAIDYGNDSVTNYLTTDQRGYPRLSGSHVDIGAVEVQYAPENNPPRLMNAASSGVGGSNSFQFAFTNASNSDFTVLGSTNVSLPLSEWTPIGNAAQNLPGQYQFTDPGATGFLQRFYRVVSP